MNQGKHGCEKLWKDAMYTSITDGSRRGQSCTKEGMLKFNSLCEMVKAQWEKEETGGTVEKQLQAWCSRDNSLPAWLEAGGGWLHRMSWVKRGRKRRSMPWENVISTRCSI
jgi:hypothetical protein